MTVPEDFKAIEPAKIAVEPEFIRDDYRFWQDGRKMRKLLSYKDFQIRDQQNMTVYFGDIDKEFYE